MLPCLALLGDIQWQAGRMADSSHDRNVGILWYGVGSQEYGWLGSAELRLRPEADEMICQSAESVSVRWNKVLIGEMGNETSCRGTPDDTT